MNQGASYTRDEFVKKYGSFIHKSVKGTGILAGTLIAQAILESSGKDLNGDWKVGGSKLSREANNFFGIKSSKKWGGKTYNIDTGEVIKGKKVIVNADFRAYNSVKDSIEDYVKLIKENPRFSNVLKAKTVKDQAIELKKAGYATSVEYADTVTQVYNSVKDLVDESYLKYKKRNTIKNVSISLIVLATLIGSFYYFKKNK
jgi:flagellum-specific peptidoglycan hydrolase FlgJ